MAATSIRFGERWPFRSAADPDEVRKDFLNRLGGLFNFVASLGDWGGATEPITVDIKVVDGRRIYNAVGGTATFGTAKALVEGVGVVSTQDDDGNSLFVIATCAIDQWNEEKREGSQDPLVWRHVLPEIGVDSSDIPDLDLYSLGLLNLTTFTKEDTSNFKRLLLPPAGLLPNPAEYYPSSFDLFMDEHYC